ncbi:MAG: hypothetical protein KC931_26400 [Candidatus Omnitrophica bacterium]|nr:hypothetical protein [Candidatus Omnitrophota bacterium]
MRSPTEIRKELSAAKIELNEVIRSIPSFQEVIKAKLRDHARGDKNYTDSARQKDNEALQGAQNRRAQLESEIEVLEEVLVESEQESARNSVSTIEERVRGVIADAKAKHAKLQSALEAYLEVDQEILDLETEWRDLEAQRSSALLKTGDHPRVDHYGRINMTGDLGFPLRQQVLNGIQQGGGNLRVYGDQRYFNRPPGWIPAKTPSI